MSKKTKEVPNPTKRLYLVYESSSEGGECESDEPYSSRTPTYKTVRFTSVLREKMGFFGHDFEVTEEVYNGSQVFLVVVRYQDGDSFGTSHGNWEMWQAVGSAEEALKIKQDILSGALTKKGHYLPWEGYFCRLEDVEIHSFQIGRNGADIQYH